MGNLARKGKQYPSGLTTAARYSSFYVARLLGNTPIGATCQLIESLGVIGVVPLYAAG